MAANDSKLNLTLDQIISLNRKKGRSAQPGQQLGRGGGRQLRGRGRGKVLAASRGGGRGAGGRGGGRGRPGLKTGGRGYLSNNGGRMSYRPVITSAKVRMAQKILQDARRRQNMAGSVRRQSFSSNFSTGRQRSAGFVGQQRGGGRWRRGGPRTDQRQMAVNRVKLDRNFNARQRRQNLFSRSRPLQELENKRRHFGVMRSDVIWRGSEQIQYPADQRRRGRGRRGNRNINQTSPIHQADRNGGQLLKISIKNRLSYGGARDQLDTDRLKRSRSQSVGPARKQNLSLSERFSSNEARRRQQSPARSRGGRGRGRGRGGLRGAMQNGSQRKVFF